MIWKKVMKAFSSKASKKERKVAKTATTNITKKKTTSKTPKKKKKVIKIAVAKTMKKKTTSKIIKKKKVKKQSKKAVQKKEKTGERKFDKTGIAGFDALFHKDSGIPAGASVLVEGGPGSGKTLFCLATLNNLCNQGKKCLYMSFEESEESLKSHMRNFGWDAESHIKRGLLRMERFDAIDVSRSIEALLSSAKKELLIDVDPVFFPTDFKADFVVIDSLTSISSAFSGKESRFRIYMEQLFRYLEENKITNFLVREVSSPSHIGTTFKEVGEAVSFLSDGIIVLYNVIYSNGKRGSAIEILKMRGSSFKKQIVDFKLIDKKGIFINPNKILKRTKKKDFELT